MSDQTQQPTVFGAILLKGGRGEFMEGSQEWRERDTYAPFDIWKFTEDFNELMAAPDDRVIVATTPAERIRELEEKYPPPDDKLSYLADFVDYVRTEPDTDRNYYRRQRYKEVQVSGACVLPYPLLKEQIGEDELQHLCIQYKSVYIRRHDYSTHSLKQKSFCVYEGCNFHRITYNPRNTELKEWRVARDKIKVLLEGKFPSTCLTVIRKCLCPSTWPDKHVYGGLFDARDNNTTAYIMRLLKVTQDLFPKKKMWRGQNHVYLDSTYHGYSNRYSSFKSAVATSLVYIWGVEDRCRNAPKNEVLEDGSGSYSTPKVMLEFCTWLRAEAKALKLKMPPKPVLPPKPLSAREIEQAAARKLRQQQRARKKQLAKKLIAALPKPKPESAAPQFIVTPETTQPADLRQAA